MAGGASKPAAALRQLKVVRYNQDGGYAPREWARAIEAAGIDAAAGEPVRVGVQITKSRAVDVVVRVERIDTLGSRVRAALGRSESERLFKSRKARTALGMGRGLAVLAGETEGCSVRVLVGEPG
jgi:hypothetical protein